MKNAKYISVAAVAAVFLFSMCDYVTAPRNVVINGGGNFDTTKRVALIEEWTGHTCIACPAAARDIHTLDSIYGESFIAISIHDDYFAEPCPPHPVPNCATGVPGAFAEDFRCPTGLSYSATWPAGPSSPPQGLVNRLHPSDQVITRGAWPALVDSIVQENAATSIHLDPVYNTNTRALTFTAWGTWLQAYTGNVNVAVMLTESGMVGWQTDGTSCDSQFVFEHVLRECVNTPGSITGTQVFTGTSVIGTTWSYTLPSAYTLPVAYDASHCHLIAILYDVTTQEVIQAWEEDL